MPAANIVRSRITHRKTAHLQRVRPLYKYSPEVCCFFLLLPPAPFSDLTRLRVSVTLGAMFPMFVRRRCLALMISVAPLASPSAAAQDAGELPLEHPVIKPMEGATLNDDTSRMDDFGQMAVRYRQDGRSVNVTAEGRFWHLEYQLLDTATSGDEIMANYASEVSRLDGEVIEQGGTRLRFRLFRPGGSMTWGILDVRRGGRYEIEIIDETGLDLSLEFDADALLGALTRTGRVALYGILFDVDSAALRPGSGEVLDTVATVLKGNLGLRLEVQGHTDSTGTADRNRDLSLARARAVVAALQLYGVGDDRLVPRGFGPDVPVADNATEEGRQQNRRVELVRLD